LLEDEASVPVGSVVIVAVKDEASRLLSQGVKDLFIGMGAKEIQTLAFREGYLFMGVKGMKTSIERKGMSVNGGVVLGYSRVKKVVKSTKTVTKSFKKTVTRVVKKVITETKNGITRTKTITRI